MKRLFFRPIFDFPEPFFPLQRRLTAPAWKIRVKNLPYASNISETQSQDDPQEIFDRFFKENELKNQAEKDFFKKNYPEKVEEKFDPYQVLEIKKEATLQEAKEAYRNLALKYHPKNNTSPEAPAKFAEISKAYAAISQPKKSRYEDFGFNTFFEDFDKEVESIFSKKSEEVKQAKDSKETIEGSKDNFGQLYSQSSNYETLNGKQIKYVIEKIYKKDGKLLSVKRQEKLKDDGKVEITEVIDNGKEVKKKTYIQENDVKKISS